MLKRQLSTNLKEPEVKRVPQVGKRDTLVELSMGDMITFPKQRQAVEELQAKRGIWKDDLRIFSYEVKGGSGERRYLVTTVQRFWKWYKTQEDRHMYELIYEDMPCRLYFDLEYLKEYNQDAVYEHFVLTLTDVLLHYFDLHITPEKDLLVLDSSTDKKFSAHIICHFQDNILFPSSTSIRHLSDMLSRKLLENPPFKLINSEGKEIPLFDSSVYSKNRNFRMFRSSKLGKTARLELADYCRFYELRGLKKSDELIFKDSLCVPANYKKYPLIEEKYFPKDENYAETASSSGTKTYCTKKGENRSPLPQIDEFIIHILKKWTHDVYIRSWKINERDGKITSVTYYPGNSRYCFNIGREHKSNGTYWIVDIEKHHFFQKCFDPDCRGNSSNLFPLPDFVSVQANKNEEESDQSILEISHIEEQKFFSNWESVFDS